MSLFIYENDQRARSFFPLKCEQLHNKSAIYFDYKENNSESKEKRASFFEENRDKTSSNPIPPPHPLQQHEKSISSSSVNGAQRTLVILEKIPKTGTTSVVQALSSQPRIFFEPSNGFNNETAVRNITRFRRCPCNTNVIISHLTRFHLT